MWEFLGTIAGPILGFLTHRYLGERKWKKVRDKTVQILKDPTKTDDPKEAIGAALLQVELNRLSVEADKALAKMRATPGWNDK